VDATHLCEFHQVEGLVADYDLSLGDLIGIIETFFKKIGITQLRFKPAFNPYTEVRILAVKNGYSVFQSPKYNHSKTIVLFSHPWRYLDTTPT
jgi:hypothetical protein